MRQNEILVPLLPTRGVVIFPEQKITIEAAREISITALENAMQSDSKHIVVASQRNIHDKIVVTDKLYKTGTLCEVMSVTFSPDKTYCTVVLKGIKIVEITNFVDLKLYYGVECVQLPFDSRPTDDEALFTQKVITELEKMTNLSRIIPSHILRRMYSGLTAIELANLLSQYYPFPLDTKVKLLESKSTVERLFLILEGFRYEAEYENIENEINSKVKKRFDDSQKDYYLREKMRAIKEELGDISNDNDEIAQYRQMIQENPYPQYVKDKALEELSRYESMNSASSEASVIRTYIDWLLKTPWYQETIDVEDLNQVMAVLDEDHYGLSKIKDRIMEYLAVKQMTKSLKSPILCLVGPPGVGKTSLAKSIAKALNRKFVKMSLGGVRDEAEIRGHRRTYIGSMPGRIIQGMKKVQVINPVFLIDEIDKLGSDYKGDPSSAMLEVLDPEQNNQFSDHYLEEAYDLSKVMFIATANYLEDIPEALRDRLEIITLSSYTEIEKVAIAKNYLIAKQVKENGLKASQIKISEKELIYLIRHYTREAGVRQLERIIATLCRKTVLDILKNNKKSVTVTKKLINEWLGREKFEYGNKEKNDQVGVVTGLAYTSFGGDVLPVEVTYFDGKGKLIITGQLGEVMKESVEIALDYIKSKASVFNIKPEFFETHDIHIHVPEGAVPKDGPSAGVTLTTAIVSALTNQKVHRDLAMTGEVTLRGHVLPIGGLREKSLAAHRVGIKKVVIPKGNLKDLEDVPEIVKESIEFVPVENVSQVLKEAIVK